MKFFDLEMNGDLSRAQKKKGGTRDVFFEVIDGQYGCAGKVYTNTAGQQVSLEACNVSGQWYAMYLSGVTSSCEMEK